jgi:hypothetical protein
MVSNKKIFQYIIGGLCFLFCIGAKAQGGLTDMRLRANVGVAYEPTKKLELTARYRLTTNQNMGSFMRSMFSLNAGYTVMKGLDLGVEYRYNTDYNQDFHRYFVYGRYKYSFGDFDLSYRLRYQQDQDYFNAEYLSRNPVVRVFRNRLMVKYSLDKKTDFYVYADHFSELGKGQLSPFRVRYGVGGQYTYKKRHNFGLEFFVNDEFNSSNPEDIGAIDVSYIYHLRGSKKKKSKGPLEQ